MSSNALLVIGSGPGIGVSTASLFAQKKFDKIALISRDKTRLSQDRDSILQSVKASNRKVEVETWSVDITHTAAFQAVLQETEKFAVFSCVLFNAARVEPSDLLTFPEQEIIKDFTTTNIALYTTAAWALPLLSQLKPEHKPSLLVTSSLLWQQPFPMFFSLSLVKASQRNLVVSLAMSYPDVHIATLNVGGQVSKEHRYFNQPAIAEKFWELYEQEKDSWTFGLDVLEE